MRKFTARSAKGFCGRVFAAAVCPRPREKKRAVQMSRRDKELPRRDFLDYLLGGSLLAGLLAILGAIVRFVWPPEHLLGVQYSDRLLVGKVDEIPVGTAVRKIFNGRGVLVLRNPSGFIAVDVKCTHQKCNVHWNEARKLFVCPCHGGLFDSFGNVISGPPSRPLRQIPVRILGDSVYLVSRGV